MTSITDSSREIIQTRIYKAPKELLLRMWSNPEHITHWWGPAGFSTTTHEMQFKPGGLWKYTMHGPDGTDYPNCIRYIHISPDRIEYRHGGEGKPVDFHVRVDFYQRGDMTEMNFCMTFSTSEERDRVAAQYGAVEGLASTMGRLDEYAAAQNPNNIELVIVRKFKAPRVLVWKALTEGEQIKQWSCPAGLELERSNGDAIAGGKWSARMVTPSGYGFDSEGEYLEVSPMDTLKYTHRWKKEDGSYKPTTLISISLTENDGFTTLCFVQAGFWSEEARAAHLGGWSSTIENLGKFVGATTADRVFTNERIFNAPLELVWKCWTDPSMVPQWFAPKPYTCSHCEIDLRAGGNFKIVMRSPDGHEHMMVSEITDVEPLESFAWVNTVRGFDDEVALQGGTMVRFEDLGGSTKVTVNSYGAAYSEMGAMMVAGMEMGWTATINQCVEVAEAAARK